ncbi:TBC1 domain family member 13 [Nematocida homosporus]|uniref:TBC1 domain family member 13 n=1 Tax=Nematocida homosporus TaxID=1912981 RepID=UPI00222048AA|nr:TBC1 domain family member 13 [Nematocida homosporus]KAI5185792.1 TBC1 domain family member 13 [Nematocida homosporus]
MSNRRRKERWMALLGCVPPQMSRSQFLEERKGLYDSYLVAAEKTVPSATISLIKKDIERTRIVQGGAEMNNDFVQERKEAIERVLMVYALTNKTIGYVQGMNWICAIVHYVMISGGEDAYAESLTYFCFFGIMVDMGDLFSEKMDVSALGMSGQTEAILAILQQNDTQLYQALHDMDIFHLSAFHLRWMFLLFAGELPLSETLCLWDRLFQERPIHRFLPFFCAAVLIQMRNQLMGRVVHDALLLLQKPKIDIQLSLKRAEKMMRKVKTNK